MSMSFNQQPQGRHLQLKTMTLLPAAMMEDTALETGVS